MTITMIRARPVIIEILKVEKENRGAALGCVIIFQNNGQIENVLEGMCSFEVMII